MASLLEGAGRNLTDVSLQLRKIDDILLIRGRLRPAGILLDRKPFVLLPELIRRRLDHRHVFRQPVRLCRISSGYMHPPPKAKGRHAYGKDPHPSVHGHPPFLRFRVKAAPANQTKKPEEASEKRQRREKTAATPFFAVWPRRSKNWPKTKTRSQSSHRPSGSSPCASAYSVYHTRIGTNESPRKEFRRRPPAGRATALPFPGDAHRIG